MKKITVVEVKVEKHRSVLTQIPMESVSKPEDVALIMTDFIGNSDREHMVVMTLNTKNSINAIHTVSIGTLNASIVHPRDVFKVAILTNAASIIICHNHPSGDPSPSIEDRDVTSRIYEAGKIIGIELVDHSIVSDNKDKYLSFKEKGLL